MTAPATSTDSSCTTARTTARTTTSTATTDPAPSADTTKDQEQNCIPTHHDQTDRRAGQSRQRELILKRGHRSILKGVPGVLTIQPGHSVKYLTREVATGRENYYTGAVSEGEPPGRWYGAGAEALGLTGLVDHQDMEALFEHFLDPRDPNFSDRDGWDEASTLGHAWAARTRPPRSCTASSWTPSRTRTLNGVNSCGWTRPRMNARTSRSWTSRSASRSRSPCCMPRSRRRRSKPAGPVTQRRPRRGRRTSRRSRTRSGPATTPRWTTCRRRPATRRVGHHGGGAGRFIDAHDWTVASFFQHTSRDNDPQLHIHDAILWRVQGADGDVAHAGRARACTCTGRPRARSPSGPRPSTWPAALRVLAAMRPDGKSREILGIDQAINDLFSSRRRTISPKAAELVGVVRAAVRPRTERAGTRPAATPGHGRSPGRASRTTARRSSNG